MFSLPLGSVRTPSHLGQAVTTRHRYLARHLAPPLLALLLVAALTCRIEVSGDPPTPARAPAPTSTSGAQP